MPGEDRPRSERAARSAPGKRTLAYSYVNESGGPPYLRDFRCRQFCASVGLQFEVQKAAVRWKADARDFIIRQIKLFAEMFSQRHGAGGWLIAP